MGVKARWYLEPMTAKKTDLPAPRPTTPDRDAAVAALKSHWETQFDSQAPETVVDVVLAAALGESAPALDAA